MAIKYDAAVNTDNAKIEYVYKLQEVLRLEHNAKGDEFTNGLITKQEWNDYLLKEFNPKQESISMEIVRIKDAFKGSVKYSPDTSKDFV